MSEGAPTIAVVIPAYNSAPYLAETLAAITGQDAAAGLEPGTKKSRIIAALRDKPED